MTVCLGMRWNFKPLVIAFQRKIQQVAVVIYEQIDTV
jgi:hypothetical protein